MTLRKVGLLLAAVVLTGCASGPSRADARDADRRGPAVTIASSISIGMDEDLKNYWEAITSGGGSGARELANIVNQHLVAITADGSPTPRLLAELISFEKGTWRVLSDGKMETTYRLRPDVLWHDGTPFTAEDVVFSIQVNRDPDVPNANRDAMRLIDTAQAPDRNTVVVTWREAYPFADRMEHRDLFPLPKHLIEPSYVEGSKEAFLAQPYFNTDYVGLGPFTVTRWEGGSHIDLAAFDRYFLGRPKLDAIRIQFIPDDNTMLANLNARAIQAMLTLGSTPDFDAMLSLKREWEASGHGTVLMDPISYRFVEPQQFHAPQPSDLRNPVVRKALLHAIDREALANAIFSDFGTVAHSWLHPSFAKSRELDGAVAKYAHDPRRAGALMADAGWRPGGDELLEKAGQKFAITMRDSGGDNDALIIAADWKKVGIGVSFEQRTAAALRDRQDRATFTGVDISSNPMGVAAVVRKTSGRNIPTADNRWTGTNRGGYSNSTWDDLELRMVGALEEGTRLEIERDLLRIYTTDLPLLPLYFRNDLVPVGGGLRGPVANTGVAHRGFILHTWNVHEWQIG